MSGPNPFELAEAAHAGQTDKAGEPYYNHVFRVAETAVVIAKRLCPEAIATIQVAALLHDVVEDTPHTFESLERDGYSVEALDIVRLLTRHKSDGRTYLQWIDHIAESGNIGAIIVKFADNMDNASPTRVACLPVGERGKVSRYTSSMRRLIAAVPDLVEFAPISLRGHPEPH